MIILKKLLVAQTIMWNKLNRRTHTKHKNVPFIYIFQINFGSSVGGYEAVFTAYIYSNKE
jgi:hypothetical protein